MAKQKIREFHLCVTDYAHKNTNRDFYGSLLPRQQLDIAMTLTHDEFAQYV